MNDTEQLVTSAKSGNIHAFEKLIETYIPTIERFAFQCGVPLDQIDDVTQEVCIKIYRFLHQFKKGNFTTWLYQITLNVIRDDYRRKQSMQSKLDLYQNELRNNQNVSFLPYPFDDELHNAITNLEVIYKIPLVLYYFHELTYKEIAEVLKISMPNVKLRIMRAKKKLKKKLEGTS